MGVNTMLSSPPILGLFNLEIGHVIPIVAIVFPFLMVIAVQVAKSISRTQRERMRCEVMRAAIERGQPIPPEILRGTEDPEDEPFGRATAGSNDIRTGLICMGVGAGMFLMFATFSIGGFDGLQGLRWIGAVPGFVGVALLINGFINRPNAAADAPREIPPAASSRDLRG